MCLIARLFPRMDFHMPLGASPVVCSCEVCLGQGVLLLHSKLPWRRELTGCTGCWFQSAAIASRP